MPRNGAATKEKILDTAQQLVLDHGFGGMSVDQIIEGAGITKGGFFYHFKTKNDLAQSLLARYVQMDDALLHDLMDRAENLSHDPLQQYLIFTGLLEEMLRGLTQPPPGCLIASYVYQRELFDVETKQLLVNGFAEWERVLSEKILTALAKHATRIPVTAEIIVHNLLALFEGGVIMAKLYDKGSVLGEQVGQHKNYVELLFGQHG